MGKTSKLVMTVAGVALVGTAGVGVAQATSSPSEPAPAKDKVTTASAQDSSAPSACRPANHKATIKPDDSSAGHLHYRVTLTAGSKTSDCKLAGSPSDVKFYNGSSLKGVTAKPTGEKGQTVRFGPGHPAHFDIQVPNQGGGAPADRATFTLNAPGGTIPGSSEADGAFKVDAGTQIGPIQSGA